MAVIPQTSSKSFCRIKMQHFELEQLERLHSEDTPHD